MEIRQIAEILFTARQRDAFTGGSLSSMWAKQYPELFDKYDESNAQNQPDKHFFEWLAAIVIFNATGYLSLVEKYEFRKHINKREILKKILNGQELSILDSDKRQCPDLFVYSPDYKDWFFCEVKGDTDRLRKTQEDYFKQLMEEMKKPVFLIKFKKK